MNKLLMTAAIAAGFFFLATESVQAQPRPNPYLYRQTLVRPVPQPLPVLRINYASPYSNYVPYTNWSAPVYQLPYVTPAYTYPSYYPSTYPSYYQNTYPSYYQNTYPSYYQNTYPSYNSYYNPYAYPTYNYRGGYGF